MVDPPTNPPTHAPYDCSKPSPWCPDPKCPSDETKEPNMYDGDVTDSIPNEPQESVAFKFRGMFRGLYESNSNKQKKVECVETPFGVTCE